MNDVGKKSMSKVNEKMWRTMIKVIHINEETGMVEVELPGKIIDEEAVKVAKFSIPIKDFPCDKIVTERYVFGKVNLDEDDLTKLVFDFEL